MMRSSDFVLKTKKAMEDLFSRGGGVTTTLKDHPSGREGVSLELDSLGAMLVILVGTMIHSLICWLWFGEKTKDSRD